METALTVLIWTAIVAINISLFFAIYIGVTLINSGKQRKIDYDKAIREVDEATARVRERIEESRK